MKEQHSALISTLRLDIKLLKLAANERNKILAEQSQDHALELEEERCGHANRITALKKLHNEEIEKRKAELRALAKQSFDDKKTCNEVSQDTII